MPTLRIDLRLEYEVEEKGFQYDFDTELGALAVVQDAESLLNNIKGRFHKAGNWELKLKKAEVLNAEKTD
jgi:hypothetical protein